MASHRTSGRGVSSPVPPSRAPSSQASPRKQPVAVQWPKSAPSPDEYDYNVKNEASENAFKNCPDFSELNSAQFSKGRMDTFKTPSRLEKRSHTPTRIIDKRCFIGDTRDLHDICEAGFTKGMKNIGAQILSEVREQILEVVREELHPAMESIKEMINHVQDEQQRPQHVDFTPMNEELNKARSSIEGQQEVARGMLSEALTHLQAGQQHNEKIEQTLAEVHTETQKLDLVKNTVLSSEAHLAEIRIKNASLVLDSEIMSNGVAKLQQDHERLHAELMQHLDDEVRKPLDEKATDNGKKLAEFFKAVHNDFAHIWEELRTIQQGLNLDFAHLVDDLHEQMDKMAANPIVAIEDTPGEKTAADVAAASLAGFELGAKPPEQERKKPVKKRMREFWVQTDICEQKDSQVQTDRTMKSAKTKGGGNGGNLDDEEEDYGFNMSGKHARSMKNVRTVKKAVFADKEAMKQKVRAANMHPPYNVFDYYYDQGVVQFIAKHRAFDTLTQIVILANAIWIAVDTDQNDAAVLHEADLVFQIVENLFCAYFTVELLVRFFAFRRKKHCLGDGWFVFDTALVSIMITETWIVPCLFLLSGSTHSGPVENISIIRMIRMVRMLRISRMVRLMRAVPELVMLMKGLVVASRSVFVFFLLWLIIIYVFAVVFRQLTDEEDIGERYFASVPEAMNTLLLEGVLPETSSLVNEMTNAKWFLWPIIMIFILLASLTIMYMLIGVLVDVMASIAVVEKEHIMVSVVASELRQVLTVHNIDMTKPLSKREFQKLLETSEVISILASVGCDVMALAESSDLIYDDIDRVGCGMSFESFVDTVLNMRGTNAAHVRDITQWFRVIKVLVHESNRSVCRKVEEEFSKMHHRVQELAYQDIEASDCSDEVSIERSPSDATELH